LVRAWGRDGLWGVLLGWGCLVAQIATSGRRRPRYGSTLVVADRGSNAAANPACLAESVETIGTASGAGTGQGDPLANAQGEERCMGSPMCSSANCEDGASVELDRTVTATRQQVAPKPEPVPVGSDRRDRRDRIGNGTRLAAAGRIWTDPAVGPARSRP
jgi:hypothetical protein